MEIKQLTTERIHEAMLKSAAHQDITSLSNFRRGWLSCLRFVMKVEKAETMCIQCGKLLNEGEVVYDQGYEPFCKKCFDKVFNQ